MAVLPPSFFNRSCLTVAKELLGKHLVRSYRGKQETFLIKEVEAYDGFDDKASHASRGKTKRNEVMFGPAGYFYTYLIYGMYWMLNIVTGPKDYPAAILIRSVGHYNGPGKLTKRLHITNVFNRKKASKTNGLWFEGQEACVKKSEIQRLPRVGVSYAGPIWSQKPYRFVFTQYQALKGP